MWDTTRYGDTINSGRYASYWNAFLLVNEGACVYVYMQILPLAKITNSTNLASAYLQTCALNISNFALRREIQGFRKAFVPIT